MVIDIILGLVLGLSVVMGAVRGALLEVLSLAALAVALVLCQPVGKELVPAAAWLMPGASALAVDAAATVAAGIMMFLVGTAITAGIVRLARRGGKRFTGPDRVLGGALGGCRAVLIWLVVACFVPDAANEPTTALGRQMRSSALLRLANRANPLLRLDLVQDVRTLRRLLRRPEEQSDFLACPSTRAFLSHPRVREAIGAAGMQEVLRRGDLATLLRQPAMQAALLEPGVLTVFRRALTRWRRDHPPGGNGLTPQRTR